MAGYLKFVSICICFFSIISGCRGERQGEVFTPPPTDQNHGTLISLDRDAQDLSNFVPEQFVQPVLALAKSVLETKNEADILCFHGKDTDSLFWYYQRKLLREEVFARSYGRWSDSVFQFNLHIYDSLVFGIVVDSTELYRDSVFMTGYAEYKHSIEMLSEAWHSILSTNSNILSIHFQVHGYSLFSVYSAEELKRLDFQKPDVFIDEFIMFYGGRVIFESYDEQIKMKPCAYVRYFDSTIHVMLPNYADDRNYYYDVTMVIAQPCRI